MEVAYGLAITALLQVRVIQAIVRVAISNHIVPGGIIGIGGYIRNLCNSVHGSMCSSEAASMIEAFNGTGKKAGSTRNSADLTRYLARETSTETPTAHKVEPN